jgi:ribosome production factor 2
LQIIGRLYDQHILDMAELYIQKYRGLYEFDNDKVPVGTKPSLLFSGPIFESDTEMKRVKSLMIDFFRGPVVTHIRLEGLEHVLQVRTSANAEL